MVYLYFVVFKVIRMSFGALISKCPATQKGFPQIPLRVNCSIGRAPASHAEGPAGSNLSRAGREKKRGSCVFFS